MMVSFLVCAGIGDLTGRNSEQLEKAIDVFTTVPHREAQAARAIWKQACVLQDFGETEKAGELFAQAMEYRRELVPKDHRPCEELVEEDWTDLIIYWSR
jgi:hypothetical protein